MTFKLDRNINCLADLVQDRHAAVLINELIEAGIIDTLSHGIMRLARRARSTTVR